MTGDGNWTWLHHRPRAHADRRRHRRRPRISTRVEPALGGARAGAGAGDARARRSRVRRAGAAPSGFPASGSARCRGPGATPSGRCAGIRSSPARSIAAGDTTLDGRPHAGSRPRSPVLLARRDPRRCSAAIWRSAAPRSGFPSSLRGDLQRLPRLARAGARARARRGCCRRTARSSTTPTTLLQRYIEPPAGSAKRRWSTRCAAGDHTPDAIVGAHLRGARGVAAAAGAAKAWWRICVKLERDGRARRDGEAWHIIDA